MAPLSFSDFPDDVQLNILSFLCPIEISVFACTCRRFAALCSHSSPSSDLWFAICDRRWGSKTQLRRWSATPSPRLYETLDSWEGLIGFWRRISSDIPTTTTLFFIEWTPSCIIGSRVSPSPIAASYSVRKIPFFWLGLSAAGETLSYLHPDNPLSDSDVIPVTISIVGFDHFTIEDDPTMGNCHDSEELPALEAGSSPDRLMSEIYQYFANRTSHGAEKSSRRQKKKKKASLEKCRWEDLHLVKIVNLSPTPIRPFQGVWKGITENKKLQFYLVKYEGGGAISCRQIVAEPLCGYHLIFWTYDCIFLEPPFSKEEHAIYSMRKHIGSAASFHCNMDWEIVSRIVCVTCSYELVGDFEGRVWEYKDGTFGFGLLRNDFIIDLKRITLDGYMLEDFESSH